LRFVTAIVRDIPPPVKTMAAPSALATEMRPLIVISAVPASKARFQDPHWPATHAYPKGISMGPFNVSAPLPSLAMTFTAP
jgi:hypothetical protein